MKQIEDRFEKNANQTGLHTFERVKHGVNPSGKNVYIYKRTTSDGNVFGFEVIVPNVKKAGTYPLPNGKSITYTEDFEEYPGASLFRLNGFFCNSMESAVNRFNSLMATHVEVESSNDAEGPAEVTEPKPKRERKPQTPLNFPEGEWNQQQLADFNSKEKANVYLPLQEAITNGIVELVRKEPNKAGRGKPTNIFRKVLTNG